MALTARGGDGECRAAAAPRRRHEARDVVGAPEIAPPLPRRSRRARRGAGASPRKRGSLTEASTRCSTRTARRPPTRPPPPPTTAPAGRTPPPLARFAPARAADAAGRRRPSASRCRPRCSRRAPAPRAPLNAGAAPRACVRRRRSPPPSRRRGAAAGGRRDGAARRARAQAALALDRLRGGAARWTRWGRRAPGRAAEMMS